MRGATDEHVAGGDGVGDDAAAVGFVRVGDTSADIPYAYARRGDAFVVHPLIERPVPTLDSPCDGGRGGFYPRQASRRA